MPYETQFTSVEQDVVLDQTIQVFAQRRGVAVIDLDGVLFDTRYRQIRIVRMYGEQQGISELLDIQPEHFLDWSMSTTFKRMGLETMRAKELSEAMRPFWEEHFFGAEAVYWDESLPGAAQWVFGLQQSGANIVYLTGRTESQRAATLAAFERDGFPLESTRLVMKADSAVADHEYKAAALEEIALLGEVRLGIDNEPIQINGLAERFPGAMAIWMNTDHSFRPVKPDPSLSVLKSFLRTTE